MAWATAGRNIVAFDPGVQDGVVISGVEYTAFRLDAEAVVATARRGSRSLALRIEAVVVGRVDDKERLLSIERSTRVLLPDEFPDAVLIESTYRNLGTRAVHLDRICSQRVLVDRRLAEPDSKSYDFASFQGGAYKWGTEYALMRLQPGFKQSNFQGVERRARRRRRGRRHAVCRCVEPQHGRRRDAPGEDAAMVVAARGSARRSTGWNSAWPRRRWRSSVSRSG